MTEELTYGAAIAAVKRLTGANEIMHHALEMLLDEVAHLPDACAYNIVRAALDDAADCRVKPLP